MHPVLTWVLQRLVVAPLLILVTVLLWTTLPLTLIVTGVLSAFVPGWLRPVRLLWVLVLHLSLETVFLIVMLGLWIVSGFGLFLRRPFFERIHYDIMQTYLVIFFREARRVLRLKIETVGPTPDAMPGQPLLVFCRHAGIGDSFTLMYALMHWYHREPRIVLKAMLAWDPALGVLLTRLPSRFVSPGRGSDLVAEIGVLASDLDDNDAFVIFPEGGNFTPRRRTRAIDRLRSRGRDDMAARAERLTHVLAPQPGGALAALDAAPDADVLLVAHTGLDHFTGLRDIWRELPMDKRLLMGWWRVPRSEIPTGREEQIGWLYDRWAQIDAWIEEHKPTDLPVSPGAWLPRSR
ncbi:1-acyl-sn-glycerol-3-phosphate acyltransferase [Nocardioides marmoriginsengisoli]|uniref:1-acyl-sn-glycerol-3-phosphate acyltransferase n=1 Tax=Nocardioides marmoriginsengisoli TaxID=661483 RepID=A0A3N0CBF9_9ACTN|nr:1-acyl-sn-glycerol-3-phosphate acyltransferase [Nocardioides marmoriginsengisoli]RNL60785.1 1-acyl-sn-glycerol-3-phosphate acyltransferase [Nocardioides marmoriginsengisoli]